MATGIVGSSVTTGLEQLADRARGGVDLRGVDLVFLIDVGRYRDAGPEELTEPSTWPPASKKGAAIEAAPVPRSLMDVA